MTRDQLLSASFFLVLGAFLYLVGNLMLPYAAPLAWATILAVLFHPANRLLRSMLPDWPSVTAGTLTVLVFLVAVVPALLLSGVIAREAVDGYQQLAGFLRSERFSDLNRFVESGPLAPAWFWLRERAATGEVDATSMMLSGVRWISEVAASRAASIARNVFSFFVGLGVMLFTLFFAFRDGVDMIGRLEESLPLESGDRTLLFKRLQQTLLAVVQGTAITAAAQGALLAFGLWLVGIPFFALLGTAAFFLAFLPVGGAALVWVPTVAGVLIAGEWLRGLILGVYCLAVVSTVDNLIKPIVIGSQARLSTPVLFLGILGGLRAYGVLGLFVGPAILSIFFVLIGIYRERYLPRVES